MSIILWTTVTSLQLVYILLLTYYIKVNLMKCIYFLLGLHYLQQIHLVVGLESPSEQPSFIQMYKSWPLFALCISVEFKLLIFNTSSYNYYLIYQSFLTNAKGYPCLSKRHQKLMSGFFNHSIQVICALQFSFLYCSIIISS